MKKEISPFEFKNQLLELADENFKGEVLNAGRGNPNFLATLPRKIFNLIGKFSIEESEIAYSYLHNDIGGTPKKEGMYNRFLIFLKNEKDTEASRVLTYFSYIEDQMGLNIEDVLSEFVDAYLGDHYPTPPRMLPNIEKIVKKYLIKEMCQSRFDDDFDVFATEGGTAAMFYIFNSLHLNKMIKKGDKIAMVTPIFTPYLEIPKLKEYDLDVVELKLDPELNWQLPLEELEKLKDKNIKVLCLVNPSNPPSTKLSSETLMNLKKIVEKDRKDLMIVTDDVYGTFSDNFESCFKVLPKNTLLVYSFSKYFGATGWRLGTISLAKENIYDDIMKKAKENDRYTIITPNPKELNFIDRMVADSRAVGLNHTAGISTPQQLQMCLFALNSLVDLNSQYKNSCKYLVRNRCKLLYSSLGIEMKEDENEVSYYTLINLKDIAEELYDKEFATWFEKENKINEFLLTLAKETGVILMPGKGFGDTHPTVRVSLANLKEYQYELIGKKTKKIIKEFYEKYRKN